MEGPRSKAENTSAETRVASKAPGMIQVKLSDASEMDKLMDAAAYSDLLGG